MSAARELAPKLVMLQINCYGLPNPDFDANDLADLEPRLSVEWPSYKGTLYIFLVLA